MLGYLYLSLRYWTFSRENIQLPVNIETESVPFFTGNNWCGPRFTLKSEQNSLQPVHIIG